MSGEIRMHLGYWCESQKEIDHYEDQDVDGLGIPDEIILTELLSLRIGASVEPP
jgi:hypothetical protein